MGLREYAAQQKQEIQQPQETQQAAGIIARSQIEQKEATEQALSVYREYQRNKIESELLTAEILKGLKAGEDMKSLFLTAMKVISLLTHNELLYRQAADDVHNLYTEV